MLVSINDINFSGQDKLYKKYLENSRSIYLEDIQDADKFVLYMKHVGHKFYGDVRIKYETNVNGQECVHVCEIS